MWLRRIALALALLAAALLLMSGLGVRAALWPYGTGLRLFAAAIVPGLAAAALALAALSVRRWRGAGALIALVLGFAAAAMPGWSILQARSLPAIHDITTDTANPPQFVAIVPLRAGAANPPEYAGAKAAELQLAAYPLIRPLELAAPPAQAFARAHAAAQALGWEIVGADAASGRIEAVATTRWFGFKDDVVIRVAPAAAGSRIDVRSKSRVGRSDVGANARRIQDFLAAVTRA
jgi:uncharacterized protein (DUF1499 family)